MPSNITIEYCPKCGWLLRASWMSQEILTTFNGHLESVTLRPSAVEGRYTIYCDGEPLFDRKTAGHFPEIKELKQLIRDKVAPGLSLGHSDKK
ncbi:MAG: Rdx family protein [Bacteroidetes bacterium]|nr:Rdx family protein [Bacteroidota bacterium]